MRTFAFFSLGLVQLALLEFFNNRQLAASNASQAVRVLLKLEFAIEPPVAKGAISRIWIGQELPGHRWSLMIQRLVVLLAGSR